MSGYKYDRAPPSNKGRFAPRDLRGDTKEGQRLIDLEVPDCSCPVFLRCPGCGAAPEDACVGECVVCDCEWPEGKKRCPGCARVLANRNGQRGACVLCRAEWPPGAARCPGCGVPLSNKVPCAMRLVPRPCAPTCPHARASAHDLSPEEWLGLLAGYDLEGYRGPAEEDVPSGVLSREAHVDLYYDRAGRGLRIFNRLDLVRPGVGIAASSLVGMAGEQGGLVAEDEDVRPHMQAALLPMDWGSLIVGGGQELSALYAASVLERIKKIRKKEKLR